METAMSKKFKKRGSFKKTQEDWLVKEGIISEANRSPIVEEADYEDMVEDAVEAFYAEFGEGGYLDSIGQTVEAFWNDENAPKAVKLLEKCASEMAKVINKYDKMIGRLS
jgi:hypothetical protein